MGSKEQTQDHMICLIIVYFNAQIMGCGCFYFTEKSSFTAEKTDCQMLNNEWHINYFDLSRFLSHYIFQYCKAILNTVMWFWEEFQTHFDFYFTDS